MCVRGCPVTGSCRRKSPLTVSGECSGTKHLVNDLRILKHFSPFLICVMDETLHRINSKNAVSFLFSFKDLYKTDWRETMTVIIFSGRG